MRDRHGSLSGEARCHRHEATALEASVGSYRGAARCQRPIEGGTETAPLRFTVDLGPMPWR